MSRIYLNSKRALVISKLVIIAWSLLAISFLICIPIDLYFKTELFIWVFIVFIIITTFIVVLSALTKCDKCKKSILSKGFSKTPYSNENNVYHMVGWSGIVMSILKKKDFVCMHCGERYHIQDN